MKDYTVPDDERFTGGLATTVQVAIGARVMLIRNVDVSDGLANGTQGEVVDIKYTSNRTPVAVLVRFDNEKVGKNTRMQSPVDMTEYPANVIPISRIEVSFSPTGNNLKIIRKQFPLKLCWASSIHKVQGATVSRICVSFKRTLGAWKAYVALSRSKSLDGLYLTDFGEKQIRTDSKVVQEMQRLSTEEAMPSSFQIDHTHAVSVTLLNGRSARLHFMDILSHPLIKQSDIICLTETNIPTSEMRTYQIHNTNMLCLGCSPAVNCHGLAMYIHSDMTVQSHSTELYPHLELLCAHIQSEKFTRKIALVYRSPPHIPKHSLTNYVHGLMNMTRI